MISEIVHIVHKYKIDIINAHWSIPPVFLATITNHYIKNRYLLLLWGKIIPVEKKRDLFSKLSETVVIYTIQRADKVISISDVTAISGTKISGRNEIVIIPDGIDTDILILM
jgi:hypothetical protein